MPSDLDISEAQDVQLSTDDDAPWGLRITAVRPSENADELDLDDLLLGRATRADFDGRWVQLP